MIVLPYPVAGAFVTYGLQQWTARELADKAKAASLSWLALELDDFQNAGRWSLFRASMGAAGIIPGVWYTGAECSTCPADAEFCIAEIESPNDLDNALATLPGLPMRKAIITNFAPFDTRPELAAPLIAAGVACLTEAYMGEGNPNATPENLDARAKALGWPRSAPCFGVYGTTPSLQDDYGQWLDWEHGWSAWSAESVLA